MHFRMSRKSLMVSIAVVALAGPRLAWASWTTDPVVVRSMTAQIPSIVSCSDGSGGCFVAWIETGVGLRAQHVLASGDIDPAWPSTGAVISSATSHLRVVGAVPDRDGGFYLLWSIGVSGHLCPHRRCGRLRSRLAGRRSPAHERQQRVLGHHRGRQSRVLRGPFRLGVSLRARCASRGRLARVRSLDTPRLLLLSLLATTRPGPRRTTCTSVGSG
jgi:hypothetical protein